METTVQQNDQVKAPAAKKTTSELVQGMMKQSTGVHLILILMPLMAKTSGEELKKEDPETYYQFKNEMRTMVKTLEECLPELKAAIETMN
jgi:ABC-type Zn uptake system ZnuABC Zn-binding protein ZnuA